MNIKSRPYHGVWTTPLLVIFVLAGLLGGCVSRPALVHQTYALQTAPPTNMVARSQAILAIRTLDVSPLFDGRAFVYRVGENQFKVDPYSGFLIPARRALAIPIRDYLRSCGAFKNVAEQGSQLGVNTFLEVYVNELYGDFRPSSSPAAVLSIRMLFFDVSGAGTHQPFWEKNYVRRITLREKSPAALVSGWNQALEQIIAEVTSDLETAHSEQAGR